MIEDNFNKIKKTKNQKKSKITKDLARKAKIDTFEIKEEVKDLKLIGDIQESSSFCNETYKSEGFGAVANRTRLQTKKMSFSAIEEKEAPVKFNESNISHIPCEIYDLNNIKEEFTNIKFE